MTLEKLQNVMKYPHISIHVVIVVILLLYVPGSDTLQPIIIAFNIIYPLGEQ